jgi:predicted  nucleic acid-binding Zn-ribbon protein
MGQRIDQFCEDLRLKLTNIDSGLHGLKAKIDAKAAQVDQEGQDHLEEVQRRIEQNSAKVTAARAAVRGWAEERKNATDDKITEWKTKREIGKLQHRAEQAEQYAAAAIDIALADVDEAEEAALEAWLARQDAEAVQAKKA